MAIGRSEVPEICIVARIWRYMNAGNLKPRKGLYPFCTNPRIIFMGTASVKVSFDLNIALVQAR